MAIQTCLPLTVEEWVWKVEPQAIKIEAKSINVFWGGVKIPRDCSKFGAKVSCDYLDSAQFNQPFWLIIEPMCVCGKLLYYVKLQKKNRKRQWILVEQSLVDFEISPGNLELSQSRFIGNEDCRPPRSPGCGIRYPFDTRSTLVSFQQQVSIWEVTSEVIVGNIFDFYLFDPLIESQFVINCDPFQCIGREPGWYVQFVLKDVDPDIQVPDQPILPGSP